jgi:hypothetical protein
LFCKQPASLTCRHAITYNLAADMAAEHGGYHAVGQGPRSI